MFHPEFMTSRSPLILIRLPHRWGLLPMGRQCSSTSTATNSFHNMGNESAVDCKGLRFRCIAEMNSSVELTVRVADIADNSNVSGSTVDYIMDYGGANISIGSAVSGADGNATLFWTVSGVDPDNMY